MVKMKETAQGNFISKNKIRLYHIDTIYEMIRGRFLNRYFVIYRMLLWQMNLKVFLFIYLFVNTKKSYFLRTRKFMYICVYTHVYVHMVM